MSVDYNGLTRTSWTGTWSPTTNHPVALANEIRGGVHSISGDVGDQLADINGQRLEHGMLVFVGTGYAGVDGNSFYQYMLQGGEVRNPSTGYVPNNPANWSKLTFGGGPLDGLSNVSIVSPADGDLLVYNFTTSVWENVPAPAGASLGGLLDTTITSPADGDHLVYNATSGTWENVPPSAVALALDDITDTEIVTPVDGQVLTFDNGTGKWVNDTIVQGTLPPAGAQRGWGYKHVQSTNDTTWTINHNLGTEDIIVQCFFVNGQIFLPDDVIVVDANNVVVTLATALQGKAILVGLV